MTLAPSFSAMSAAMEASRRPAPWTLRPYQHAALRNVAAAWQDHARTMLVCATGTGKTTIFAEVLRRRRDAGRGRALVLAHRLELITQAVERIRMIGLGVHVERADELAPLDPSGSLEPTDVVVATVQTMRGRRLARWRREAFGTIIIDEAHRCTAASYRAILDHFPDAKVLGVTATPDRGDGVAVGNVIEHLAFEYGLRQAVEEGYLCPIRAISIDMPSVDISSVRTTSQAHGRDLSAEDLAKAMNGEKQLHELAGPIARESGERPTLVFVPSVEIAHELARVLCGYVGAGQAEALDGSSSSDARADVVGRYLRGETRIMVNCALFTEGFDAPPTACVAIARPTKSRALYAQMVGRGTRLAPGKTDCLILDLAPQNSEHKLVHPTDLLAGRELPDDVLATMHAPMTGEDVLKVCARGEAIAKAREEKRARDQARVIADVRYMRRERDPFDELGIDGECGVEGGPRATQSQMDGLERCGLRLPKIPSRGEASRILDEVAARRRRGLCTIKQMRQLASRGLRTDLSFAEAGECMTALAANDWRMSPEIAERWGTQ